MRDQGDSNARTERRQRTLRRVLIGMIILAALIVALPCTYIGSLMYRFSRHKHVSHRMKIAITRLAFNCPSDLTNDQWAYCIAWTWNLHSNFGVNLSYIPTADLQRIVEDFEAKIDDGPSLATIDWLWAEYYRSAPNAHRYEKYRPTSPANQSQFEAGAHRGNPLPKWRSNYERLVAKIDD